MFLNRTSFINCKYCSKRVKNRVRYCKQCAKIAQMVRTQVYNERIQKMAREEKKAIEAEKKQEKAILLPFDCPNDPLID